jgi:fumarylacetoacetase
MAVIDETHDPARRSWVESANAADTPFPVQNLPFGMISTAGGEPRIGVAIGDQVLDAFAAGLVESPSLQALMARPAAERRERRKRIADALTTRTAAIERCLHPMAEVTLHLPTAIGDYTDFYASIHHATNAGKLFRPDQPLLPNYKWVPIGYHGRASSIVLTGTPVRRPSGQRKPPGAEAPAFGPSRMLDYEVELAFFAGPGNPLGEPVAIDAAGEHIFGYCLLNDWSARDIQAWEYQPLGPFLGKSFATSISPWIVTAEAHAPFRAPAFPRDAGDPQPLPYLFDAGDQSEGAVAVTLEAWLKPSGSNQRVRLSASNARDLYWTPAQLLTHHTSNGCNLRPGDLLATGTVSGESPSARGCLLELTSRGAEPIELPDGGRRAFLEDGDEVILVGRCDREGFRSIGFGECRGTVTG